MSADAAAAVREEDAFEVAAVTEWLRENAIDASGIADEPIVQQFTGGASNLTYQLSYPSGRNLILRRPPSGTKAKVLTTWAASSGSNKRWHRSFLSCHAWSGTASTTR